MYPSPDIDPEGKWGYISPWLFIIPIVLIIAILVIAQYV